MLILPEQDNIIFLNADSEKQQEFLGSIGNIGKTWGEMASQEHDSTAMSSERGHVWRTFPPTGFTSLPLQSNLRRIDASNPKNFQQLHIFFPETYQLVLEHWFCLFPNIEPSDTVLFLLLEIGFHTLQDLVKIS